MATIYKHFYSLFTQEKTRLDHKIVVRKDAPRPALQTPLTVAAALLGLGVSSLLLGASTPREKLEDHPMCGITTGGQAECYFDCEILTTANGSDFGQIITNLECLEDCFGNTIQRQRSESCLSSLVRDVLAKGICNLLDFSSPDCDFAYPYVYPYGCPTLYEGIYDINETCVFNKFSFIESGTCSMETEELLVKQECIQDIFSQPGFVQNTIFSLIYVSCNFNVYFNFLLQNSGRVRELSNLQNMDIKGWSENDKRRLAPNQQVLQFENFATKTQLNYENTRHRYPWVCSLQTRGASTEHLCAVTLLSVPPKPTVVIGAAHCTYICKNDRDIAIQACCCSDGLESCADDKTKCGDNPRVFEMTGDDVQVLCGEWETGATPMELSGEKYNVLLPIKEIVRHPNFNASKNAGPIGGSDIAIFKVDDSSIKNRISSLQLNPICLPSSDKKKPGKQAGILAAWSKPPPFHYVEQQATGYLSLYRDFFKQWHYKMDIETCRDPLLNGILGGELTFPSNSSYPPGTVCAKEISRTCFTSGESGSPLMVKEKTRPMRFFAEGILSFVKGCDVFTFGAVDDEKTKWLLNQQSENPTTFTKLSCFLPWVAQQYEMEYKPSDETEPACFEGQGDPLNGENTCRITPSSLIDTLVGEVECIFPFYYDGKRYDGCVLFDIYGLLNPIFRCPTRNITTKIDGINSFPASSFTEGLCLTNRSDPTSDLDPTIPIQDCNLFARRASFSQCKNNCPGVRAFGLIGGGAALAFLGVTSALQSLVPAAFGVGAIGVAGLGGNMVAQMMCSTPYCRTLSGSCCLLGMSSFVSGLKCPDTC